MGPRAGLLQSKPADVLGFVVFCMERGLMDESHKKATSNTEVALS